jgi:phenylpropionate dioxygenase-like ring-hydroxylating dioxygenase large terminal subunit
MNKETSELLTRTGPGTPMGELLRRYWVPVLLSNEIAEPDCPPVRVPILGEKLLAFRDTSGRVGLIDEFCTHRGVSLFFGRNEEDGIRCSYHGVKFAYDGTCVEVPSAPQMCDKMGIKAYPCVERGGVVWAYMGPADKKPAPPEVEWCTLPVERVFVSRRWQQSNYLQAMEGGIDTAHVSYVHSFEVDDDPLHQGVKALDYIKADGNVVFEIEKNDFGLTLYGRRHGEPDTYYWRVTQWLFPWFTLIPPFGDHALAGHVWVPMDDENCWTWSINFHPDKALNEHELEVLNAGKGIHAAVDPKTLLPLANASNDYFVDRVAQKEKRSYSGVFGFGMQDASLQESMGPIQNHEAERLLPTDRGIVMARRMLHDAVLDLQNGVEPPALDATKQRVRAAGVLLDKKIDPAEWAKDHLADSLDKKVYTL